MLSFENKFDFLSEKAAKAAAAAVSVELSNTFEKRSKAQIHTNKNVVLLKIVAQDESALNASKGFYSRLFVLCQRLLRR